MALRDKFTVLRAKSEATEGTDPTAVQGDEVRAWDVEFGEDYDSHVMRNTDVSLSPSGAVIGARRRPISFKTYLLGVDAANGASGVPAEFDPLFAMCGMAVTYTPETGNDNLGSVAFRRASAAASTGNGNSACIEKFVDGTKVQALGCRGSLKFGAKVGEPVIAEWTARGHMAAPTTAALPSISIDSVNAVAWISASLTSLTPSGAGAYTPAIGEFAFDIANVIAEVPSANAADGVSNFELAGGETKFTMKVVEPLEATHAFRANMLANTPYALSIQVGSTVQQRLTITAPVARITSISPSAENGIRMLTLSGVCCRSADAGNDELVLTFT